MHNTWKQPLAQQKEFGKLWMRLTQVISTLLAPHIGWEVWWALPSGTQLSSLGFSVPKPAYAWPPTPVSVFSTKDKLQHQE